MIAISIKYLSVKGKKGKITEKIIALIAICVPLVSKKFPINFPIVDWFPSF